MRDRARKDLRYHACHQAAAWFLPATRAGLGLTRAASVATFPDVGSLSACNIPLGLQLGVERGLLADGDLYVLASGGAGETWSVCVGRWGAAA